MDKWISVNDRMPLEGERVLVFDGVSIEIDEVISYIEDGELFLDFESSDDVEYWCELPPIPTRQYKE